MSKVGAIIGAMIGVVISVALTPTIAEQTSNAQQNLTGAANTLMGLVPLLWVALPVFGAMIGGKF